MENKALATIREQARFYISTPDRAAEALLFVKKLKRFADEVEEKVKARAVEVMDRDNVEMIPYTVVDPDTGEVEEWEARRAYATESKEYRPENVFNALGLDSLHFFKVSKGELEKYLKTESAKGNISMQVVEAAVSDPIVKTRKSAGVILRAKK